MTQPTKSSNPTVTDWEQDQVDRANASGRIPVVLVHGLWLLANSWEPWTARLEDGGYVVVAPGWPDDPTTIADARRTQARSPGSRLAISPTTMTPSFSGSASSPRSIGHSFGGLLTEILAGRGLARFGSGFPRRLSAAFYRFLFLRSAWHRSFSAAL